MLMEEWDPQVRWLCDQCQPTNNGHALLKDRQKLMDNIRSKKVRTTSLVGEVENPLEDDLLEDTHDNGEDGNTDEDWVTNNEEEDDAEGTGNRGGKEGEAAEALE
jgi:hypothetical protein